MHSFIKCIYLKLLLSSFIILPLSFFRGIIYLLLLRTTEIIVAFFFCFSCILIRFSSHKLPIQNFLRFNAFPCFFFSSVVNAVLRKKREKNAVQFSLRFCSVDSEWLLLALFLLLLEVLWHVIIHGEGALATQWSSFTVA